MTREKKKLTYSQLEDHVVYWATDRLEEFRQITDRINRDVSMPEEEKEIVYNGIAQQIANLLELITSLPHDEEYLMLWANEFVDEYAIYDDFADD